MMKEKAGSGNNHLIYKFRKMLFSIKISGTPIEDGRMGKFLINFWMITIGN